MKAFKCTALLIALTTLGVVAWLCLVRLIVWGLSSPLHKPQTYAIEAPYGASATAESIKQTSFKIGAWYGMRATLLLQRRGEKEVTGERLIQVADSLHQEYLRNNP